MFKSVLQNVQIFAKIAKIRFLARGYSYQNKCLTCKWTVWHK